MFRKKKPQIRLELTYPAPNRTILWAVVPDYNYRGDKWFKVMEYIESIPPDPDPNLVSWKTADGSTKNNR